MRHLIVFLSLLALVLIACDREEKNFYAPEVEHECIAASAPLTLYLLGTTGDTLRVLSVPQQVFERGAECELPADFIKSFALTFGSTYQVRGIRIVAGGDSSIVAGFTLPH